MINKKTKEIYSNKNEIELFYSPKSKPSSIVSKILNREYSIVMNIVKGMMLDRGDELTALDIGCSGGRYCFSFSKLGIKTTGIDISKQAIDFSNKKKKQLKLKNLSFKVSEATN